MKKLFLGALGLLALASCSDELTGVNRDGDEIAFNVVTNPVSRASDVYCNLNKPTQFNVWASFDSKLYIDGDLIEYNSTSTKWENKTGLRYWPDGEVTFFAYHNAGSAFNYNNGAPKIENFTVANAVADQVDLIYSVKKANRPAATANNPVTLNFRHALSQIVFQAKNTNPNLYVEISGVSICKVKNTGTFTYPTANTDNNINHGSTTGVTPSYTDGSWGSWGNTLTGSVDYSVTFDPVDLNGSTDAEATSLTNTPDTDKEYSSNAMLLLPQESNAWNVSEKKKPAEQDNTYFLVKCRIFNVVGDAVNKATDVCLWGEGGENGAAKDVAIPVALNWEQGKKYIYTFVFGEGNGGYDPTVPTPVLVPIKFDVQIDEFVPVDNQDVTMDGPTI